MIDTQKLEWLLGEFDLGTSTAENDPLLETAKIETQEFNDLFWYDRIDIVKGIKGAGKTALYRLIYFLKDYLIEKKNLFCIFGINPTGDPIFRLYRKDFEDYNQMEFENFWNVYFIALVYNLIYTTPNLKTVLSADLIKIDEILDEIGLKLNKEGFSQKETIGAIQKIFRSHKLKFGLKTEIDTSKPTVTTVTPTVEFDPQRVDEISKRPIYIKEFRDKLAGILEENKIKIWIMLDRLDEVFPHRSKVEKLGLRGLLKASYNFTHPNLRIKIFLRDDIIAYLSADGFTALTHVTDRCSSTMSWSKDELLHLIIKRISALKFLAEHYQIDKKLIDKDRIYREKVFYEIFPLKIGKTPTMEWIFSNCADANNVVTPRDMIDLFKFAKSEQFKQYRLNPKPQETIITEETLKRSLDELSKRKKDAFLFAEFPHLKEYFLKFEGGYSEYDKDGIASVLGTESQKIVDDLKSIGFIKYIPKSASYKIPIIWRKGLSITRGKAFRKKGADK